jgi:hypothetical protein
MTLRPVRLLENVWSTYGRRQLLFGMTALGLARGFNFNNLLTAQNIEPPDWHSRMGNIRVSDRTDDHYWVPAVLSRQQAGLRGPVKIVIDEWSRTEYDRDGNTLTWRRKHRDGSEWGNTWTYDEAGHLLKATLGTSTTEEIYSYDEMGRLLSIKEIPTPDRPFERQVVGNQTTFHYDQQGRKTEIRSVARIPDNMKVWFPSDSVKRRVATAIGINSMFADLGFVDYDTHTDAQGNFARTIKTIYNDRDQPTETHAYDADWRLMSSIVRTYNAKGEIDGLKVLEYPIFRRNKQVPDQFMMESEESYSHDSQGRVTEAILDPWVLCGNLIRTYIHNDHSDIAEECTTFAIDRDSAGFNLDENSNLVPAPWPAPPPIVQSRPLHVPVAVAVVLRRRELTYY